jgi:hypothetical protein
MGNVITLSKCSCDIQKVRRAISERHHPGQRQLLIQYSGEIDRTGLKILENNKNMQSIISVNINILLRRFRLKFLRIMYSTSCYKERLNFGNTLYCIFCRNKLFIYQTVGKSILLLVDAQLTFFSRTSYVVSCAISI